MGIPAGPAMTTRIQALAIVWGEFWEQVEASGAPAPNLPGVLNIALGPIDEALREALEKAWEQGYLAAAWSLEAKERRN